MDSITTKVQARRTNAFKRVILFVARKELKESNVLTVCPLRRDDCIKKRSRTILQRSTSAYLLMYLLITLWQTQVLVCEELVLEKFSFKFTASSVGGGGGSEMIQGLLCGVE